MSNKPVPVFMMVPRKLIIAWLVSFICLATMAISAIMWANYVDRRSNQRWCGIVVLYDDRIRTNPPTDDMGRKAALEFTRLRKEFSCK